jgi:hypothetical protein
MMRAAAARPRYAWLLLRTPCPPPSHSRAQGPRSAREREKVPIRVAAVADMRGYDVLDGGPPRARARRAARTPAMCVSHGI